MKLKHQYDREINGIQPPEPPRKLSDADRQYLAQRLANIRKQYPNGVRGTLKK